MTNTTRRKRDLTEAQMEYRLRKAGWKPCGVASEWGYWEGPSGIHVSMWNYQRRRDALRDMARIDRNYAADKDAKIAAKAATP